MRFLLWEVYIFSEMRRKLSDGTIESDGVRMELQPVEYCPRNTTLGGQLSTRDIKVGTKTL